MHPHAFFMGLVVFVVTGLLAADRVPPYLHESGMRLVTECEGNMVQIATALEMYSTDNSGRYPASLKLLVPAYLRNVPTCPSAHKDTYSSSYSCHNDPYMYTIFCRGHNHINAGLSPNLPRYRFMGCGVAQ